MIISHKHKFIFFRPGKVAGTSIEIGLSQFLGEDDVITPEMVADKDIDDKVHEDKFQNSKGFDHHSKPAEIKEKVSSTVWETYTKITACRNPWDTTVSNWYWEQFIASRGGLVDRDFSLKNIRNRFIQGRLTPWKIYQKIQQMLSYKIKTIDYNDFYEYLEKVQNPNHNNNFYFDTDDLYFDEIIRFEHLQEDYDRIFTSLGIPQHILPRTKTKTRKDKRHYSKVYDEHPGTEDIVGEMFKRQITTFDYKFERK